MERNAIDYVFAAGLIVVAVIAFAELQFTGFVLSQNQVSQGQIWIQIIFVFRVTLIPIFILLAIWLLAMIIPHVKIPLAKRRYLKEFCWALLGNVLALEIVLFSLLLANGFTYVHMGSAVTYEGGIFQLIPSFFLTLLATWQYRKIDSVGNQNASRFGLFTVIEHLVIYVISYVIILIIIMSSVFLLL
jgi:hypothetical protein